MDKEVKVVVTMISTCHGCLSADRNVTPVGDHAEMLLALLGVQRECLVYGVEDIKLCWECMMMLKKFKCFQNRVKTAQTGLMKMLYEVDARVTTLSNLKTVNKSFYDEDIKHDGNKKLKKNNEQLETITFIKTEIEDDQDVDTYSDEDNSNYNFEVQETKIDETDSKVDETDKKIDESVNKLIFDNKTDVLGDKSLLEINYTYDVKVEELAEEPVKAKKPRRQRDTECVSNVVGYYKKYATLVKTEKKDWGDFKAVRKHFTLVHLSEKEMEEHFLIKDRRNTSYVRMMYKCELCTLGYMKEDDLKRHNDLNHHREGSQYKCTLCKKCLSTGAGLEYHWRLHSRAYRCKTCADVCKEQYLRKHLDHAHTKIYDCTVCHHKFGTLKVFTVHYKQMHMNYVCDYCNHKLTTKRKMEKHISEHHVTYTCKDCNRQYKNYIYYKKHCYSLHPDKINTATNPELSFCVECNKQFPSVDKYKTHLRVSNKHNKKGPVALPCPECGRVFGRKKNLNYHYNLFHLKKTKYYCEICDKYFARPAGLRTHRQNVHLKIEKPKDKICDLCGRGFSSHVVLRHHRRTHTGERPHKCPYCAAEFIQKYAMQTHVRTQHKELAKDTNFGAKDTNFGARSTTFGAKDINFGAKDTNFGAKNTPFGAKDSTQFLPKDPAKKVNGAPNWPETGYFV